MNNQDSRVSSREDFHRQFSTGQMRAFRAPPSPGSNRQASEDLFWTVGASLFQREYRGYGKISRAMQFLPASGFTLVQRGHLSAPFLNELQLLRNSEDEMHIRPSSVS